MGAITPASFLRYGTSHSAQRVDVRQRTVLGLTLSPDPCLLGDGISQLVRASDSESAHQAGSFGRWTRGSQLHPACCAVGSPHTTPGFPGSMQDEVRLLAARRPGHTSYTKTPEHSFWPKDNTQQIALVLFHKWCQRLELSIPQPWTSSSYTWPQSNPQFPRITLWMQASRRRECEASCCPTNILIFDFLYANEQLNSRAFLGKTAGSTGFSFSCEHNRI